jgi:hypothetical protein
MLWCDDPRIDGRPVSFDEQRVVVPASWTARSDLQLRAKRAADFAMRDGALRRRRRRAGLSDDGGHFTNPLQDRPTRPPAIERLNAAGIPDTYHDQELRLVGLSG